MATATERRTHIAPQFPVDHGVLDPGVARYRQQGTTRTMPGFVLTGLAPRLSRDVGVAVRTSDDAVRLVYILTSPEALTDLDQIKNAVAELNQADGRVLVDFVVTGQCPAAATAQLVELEQLSEHFKAVDGGVDGSKIGVVETDDADDQDDECE